MSSRNVISQTGEITVANGATADVAAADATATAETATAVGAPIDEKGTPMDKKGVQIVRWMEAKRLQPEYRQTKAVSWT